MRGLAPAIARQSLCSAMAGTALAASINSDNIMLRTACSPLRCRHQALTIIIRSSRPGSDYGAKRRRPEMARHGGQGSRGGPIRKPATSKRVNVIPATPTTTSASISPASITPRRHTR